MSRTSIALVLSLLVASAARAQRRVDLAQAAHSWQTIKRHVAVADSAKRTILHFDEAPGVGLMWTPTIDLADGDIDLDVRGRNVFQKSFVGISFRMAADTAFDAIYLRPFNFVATDSVRRTHAIQYVSYPGFSWEKLRADSTGKFEKAVVPAPDPNAWVHLRLELRGDDLRVFVNRAAEPALHVKTLGGRTHGGIGLWVGDLSPGDFANLVITPSKGSPASSGH
jgi:hypothetical protein